MENSSKELLVEALVMQIVHRKKFKRKKCLLPLKDAVNGSVYRYYT